ncbi:sulfate adenylyltransferase subunit 2 [Striga asiatica]|uniref:Sulfate adenylyltransferase subunit 2 n=1 Tax=Striga asiatica TaxID=4170 RepID=A0A5A7QGK9_STRAF|nr:sulfate adenylyltransferase subunit 2 [Striga asiatica]
MTIVAYVRRDLTIVVHIASLMSRCFSRSTSVPSLFIVGHIMPCLRRFLIPKFEPPPPPPFVNCFQRESWKEEEKETLKDKREIEGGFDADQLEDRRKGIEEIKEGGSVGEQTTRFKMKNKVAANGGEREAVDPYFWAIGGNGADNGNRRKGLLEGTPVGNHRTASGGDLSGIKVDRRVRRCGDWLESACNRCPPLLGLRRDCRKWALTCCY